MRDRVSQALKDQLKKQLLEDFGPYCYLCRAAGEIDAVAFIDMRLPPNLPGSCDLEHINPDSFGGKFVYENIRLAHHRCNAQKGDQNLDVYLEKRKSKRQFSRKW